MARNTNPWFKFYFRDWLESERVRRMTPGAQGLYIRALSFQAIHGSIPCEVDEISLCLQVRPQHMDDWESVSTLFEKEMVDGECRMYNVRLRQELSDLDKASAARSKAAQLTNEKRYGKRVGQRGGKRSLRASDSNSNSNSKKKDKTTKVFSETENALGKRFAKVRADISGMKSVRSEAEDYYTELVHEILSDGEATAEDLSAIADWFANTPEGKKSFTFGVGNLARGYTHVLRKNLASYLASARGGFTTPPRGMRQPASDDNGSTANYADLIPWEDSPVGN